MVLLQYILQINRMKKHIFFLIIALGFFSNSFAQKELVHQIPNFDHHKIRFGFYLGLHTKTYDFKSNNTDTSISNGAGFHLGVLADYNLNNNISLIAEPGIISTSNTLKFSGDFTEEKDLQVTYFHFPLSIKFRTKRLNNVRPYFLAGLAYDYNFSADKNVGNEGDPLSFRLTTHNYSAEAGFGINFYFEYFKFSPSIRGIFGINNEYEAIGSTAMEISEMRARGLYVTLLFE